MNEQDQDRIAARAAIEAANAVIRCRVCGALMTDENTVDPIELPDECGDCLTGELNISFD